MTDRVARHVAAFNDAVRSGSWSAFAERFAPDATLAFEGVPVGPFHGRDAIASAYDARPPTDTMDVLSIDTAGERDLVHFAWRAGGTGTMRLAWEGAAVAELVVTFDPWGTTRDP